MIGMLEKLPEETSRGLYLYPSFDEAPVFFSYRGLFERVAAAMEHFRASGVGTGTRAILPFETSAQTITAYLALIGVGALIFSVKAPSTTTPPDYRAFLGLLCERYRATHVVETPEMSVAGLPLVELTVPDAALPKAAFGPPPSGGLAMVQFSSGSTSRPKGVPVTRTYLEQQLRMICDWDERRPDDVYVSWLPLYHDMGLVMGMLSSFHRRNDLHLIPPLEFIRNPLGWLRLMSERRATHTVTPYFGVSYCLNHLARAEPEVMQGWDFRRLRSFLIGSDPTDFDRTLAFQQCLEKQGFRRRALLPAYGMAEAVLMVSGTRVSDEPWAHTLPDGRKLVSAGHLLPGFEARVTREDGGVCAEGELGEIELRGGTMVGAYFEEPGIPFNNADGYFQTGDLGYLLRGELLIAGRIGDRIKVNAQSLFSNDFEFAAESLPFIKPGRTAVFQIDDRIIVLAELSDRNALLAPDKHREAVSNAIIARLGVKLPANDILFIAPGQIKKTTSGKINRRAMAESYLKGQIRPARLEDMTATRGARGPLAAERTAATLPSYPSYQ